MSLATTSTGVWVTFALVLGAIVSRYILQSHFCLPPGPTPLPLVGNVMDMPRKHIGREFSNMTSKYGDVVYLNVLGQSMVVLGSEEAAQDLLDKRSATYSDRPDSVMARLTGLGCLFVLSNYNEPWKQRRRAFHQCFNTQVMLDYRPAQLRAAQGLLRGLLKSSACIRVLTKFSLAAIVARVAYGIELEEVDDEYFHMVERITSIGEEIAVPGRFLVEAFPILRYLPAWFPGAQFKRYASATKREVVAIVNRLYAAGVDATNTHAVHDSAISRLLSNLELENGARLDEVLIKELAITAYVGGADTTYTAFSAFFLAMAMYPDVQKKAQAELDAVIGSGRLPEFADSGSLPYVNSLIKEVHRWHPVLLIGIPHRSVAHNQYQGYDIPAGSIVIPNVWGITRNAERYPDPERFRPERFLDARGRLDLSIRDPAEFVFGFGRRRCPGREFAETTLFILCASVLHAFEIGPPVDKCGVVINMEHNLETMNAIAHPTVYDYVIKPRLPRMENLIVDTI